MAEIKFAEGLFIKRGEKAPDFVVCNVSIEVDKFRNWLTKNQEGKYINLKFLKSKKTKGNIYAQVDDWKPDGEKVIDTGITDGEAKVFENLRNAHNSKVENNIDVSEIPF